MKKQVILPALVFFILFLTGCVCMDGKCGSCIDTDKDSDPDGDGINYLEKGTAIDSADKVERTDSCYHESFGEIAKCTPGIWDEGSCGMEEFYCGQDGLVYLDLNYYACPFGCENGVCLDSNCGITIDCKESFCINQPDCLCFNDIKNAGEERTDCGGSCAAACIPIAPHPFFSRTTPNMLEPEGINWNFNGSDGWNITSGVPVYDSGVSRTLDGSGSFMFPLAEASGHIIRSPYAINVPVEPGKKYTLAAYIKTDLEFDENALSYPVLGFMAKLIKADGSSRNAIVTASVSATAEWQEVVLFFVPQEGELWVNILAYRPIPDDRYFVPLSGTLWIDDFYLGEGFVFGQPAFWPKKSFSGATVRIDSLGNYQVNREGAWEPFFPFCIYANNDTPVQSYSDIGFNCLARTAWRLDEAVEAVSDFNPDGLWAMLSLTQYFYYTIDEQPNSKYKDLVGLEEIIDPILGKPSSDHFLGFYWDSESHDLSGPVVVSDFLRANYPDYPLYILKGAVEHARALNNVLDVTGTYVSQDDEYFVGNRSFVLEHLEETQNPLGMGIVTACQFAHTPERLRTDFYQLLIFGGRGMAYYDHPLCGKALGSVLDSPLSNEFAALRTEVDQLLPLVKENHWTGWSASSSSSEIVFGTRDNGKEGFIFAVNPTDAPVITNFTISGLIYEPSQVKNFFTGETVAAMNGPDFTVTFPANGTAVYRLERTLQ